MKKKILFIINPISGKGKKTNVRRDIEKYINPYIFDVSIKETEYAGHASILTRQAVEEGFDIVVAVGGDGTVNEVARSVVHTPTAIAIVPCGSGNGLARHLQIPMNTKGAVEVINQNTVHCLDYGKIDGHPFFCTCGAGFDAFISEKFASSGKRGLKTYVENVLREGFRYKPKIYTIEDEDNHVSEKAFLIACANASQYGNNAYIAPHASMKDGLLDIIIMKPFNPVLAPQIAVQMFNKTLPKNSHIKTFKSRKIHIKRSEPGPINCYCDPQTSEKDFYVELIPHSFNVIVNPKAKGRNRSLMQLISEDILEKWQAGNKNLRRQSRRIQISSIRFFRKIRRF